QRLDLPADWDMGEQPVSALSHDGKLAAQVSKQHLHVWETATGKEVRRVPIVLTPPGPGGRPGTPNILASMEFSPDGKTLAMGNYAGTVLLWDVTAGKERSRLAVKGAGMIWAVAVSPDGKALAASRDQGDRGGIDIWDLTTGIRMRTLPGQAHRLDFFADGKTLASSSQRTAILWNVATGALEAELPTPDLASLNSLALSPDGKTIALG